MPSTTPYQPTTTGPKRQSLYSCIKNAPKFIKLKTELRRNKMLSVNALDHQKSIYINVIEIEEKIYYDDQSTIYGEHDEKLASRWSRYFNQEHLSLPSKHTITHYPMNSNPASDINDEDEYSDEEEYEEAVIEHVETSKTDDYQSTLDTLTGTSYVNSNEDRPNTAVLITLSSSALAAANAARQKRQKYHHRR
ncbi:hypothetical protein BDB01DRAFT_775534 [Pilobolus umbonatus]|nr:hypothetical protein BDB01DRAFT_775534 [Pilobolus umbonatus]